MRYLITALMVLMVLVPQAHSDLNFLPADGPRGDVSRFMDFGSNDDAWPTTTTCLSAQSGGTAHRTLCDDTDSPESRLTKPYFGQVFVRYLVCTPTFDHSLWLSASLQLAVFQVKGSDVGSDYVRNQLGGTLTFDETTTVGESQRLIINARTTLENGNLQIKFTDVGVAPVAVDNGFTCTIALFE